jgi:hypothetical protein
MLVYQRVPVLTLNLTPGTTPRLSSSALAVLAVLRFSSLENQQNWRFPKIGIPPIHVIFGFSIVNHPAIEVPP